MINQLTIINRFESINHAYTWMHTHLRSECLLL